MLQQRAIKNKSGQYSRERERAIKKNVSLTVKHSCCNSLSIFTYGKQVFIQEYFFTPIFSCDCYLSVLLNGWGAYCLVGYGADILLHSFALLTLTIVINFNFEERLELKTSSSLAFHFAWLDDDHFFVLDNPSPHCTTKQKNLAHLKKVTGVTGKQ